MVHNIKSWSNNVQVSSLNVVSMRQRVLSSMQTIPKNSVGSQMVRFDARWSTVNRTEICCSIFTNRFIALFSSVDFTYVGNSGKELKIVRAIPLGWLGLIGKCRSAFLGLSYLSLTDWSDITENRHPRCYRQNLSAFAGQSE